MRCWAPGCCQSHGDCGCASMLVPPVVALGVRCRFLDIADGLLPRCAPSPVPSGRRVSRWRSLLAPKSVPTSFQSWGQSLAIGCSICVHHGLLVRRECSLPPTKCRSGCRVRFGLNQRIVSVCLCWTSSSCASSWVAPLRATSVGDGV